MRFPNEKHPSMNIIRRFDQRLRKKNVTMTTTYGIFSYLLRWCHFHFHSLRVILLTESCRIVFGTKSGSMLCYAMVLKRLSLLFDTHDILVHIGIESITFTLIFNKLIQEGEILEIQ
jgi:hypothetical protein